jgi:hypothetical protein
MYWAGTILSEREVRNLRVRELSGFLGSEGNSGRKWEATAGI